MSPNLTNNMATDTPTIGGVDVNGFAINVPVPTAISTASLAPAPAPISITQPNYNMGGYQADGAKASSYLQSSFDTAQADVDAINKEGTAGNAELSNLQLMLGGKSEDLNNAYMQKDEAGNSVKSLAAKMRKINAESQALDYDNLAKTLEEQNKATGQNITTTAVQRNTIDATRENTIKKARLAMDAAITKADYDTAKDFADTMINAKYDKITAEIEARKTNLQALKDYKLTPAQQKRLDAQAALLKKEEQDNLKKREDEKKISDMIINATPYAPTSITANARKLMEAGKSPAEIAIALGKYGGDYLGDLVKKSTLAKNDLEMEKTRQEIKALKTPLPIVAPAGTNAYSTASWMNSAVNKESLSAGEREKISKSFAVTQQLGNLARSLQKDQTSFFGGKVREIMAAVGQDADAGAIQAQITALVPQVARGTYGEVGVLTNADVKNYRQVIGNLSSPNDQNKAVTAMTLVALRNGVKSQLDTAAASKLDVSRFVPMYQDLTNQINTINDDIGVTDIHVKNYADKNPQVKPMVEDLIKQGKKGSEILQILGVEY